MFPRCVWFPPSPWWTPQELLCKELLLQDFQYKQEPTPQHILQRNSQVTSQYQPMTTQNLRRKTGASLITENIENIKGLLLLSCSGQNILTFLFQNTLAAILLQGAREGKVCSCNITTRRGGKTLSSTHTNRTLPLTSYTQENRHSRHLMCSAQIPRATSEIRKYKIPIRDFFFRAVIQAAGTSTCCLLSFSEQTDSVRFISVKQCCSR